MGDKPPIKFNGAFCCSHNLLLLKTFEMIFMLVTVILSSQIEGPHQVIYIQIAGALAVVTCLVWVILYSANVNARFPEFFPILMFVYHFLMALLTIGVCVSAGFLWPQFKTANYPHFAISTVLSFLASVLFLVDAMLNLLWWRGAKDEINVCPCSPWQADLV